MMAPKQQSLFPDQEPAPKRDKRTRYQFRFWLDGEKDDELLMAEELDQRKNERRFAGFMRDAIRLMASLEAGQTDVLEAMFPDIYQSQAPKPESAANEQFAALIAAKIAETVSVPVGVGGGAAASMPSETYDELEALAAETNIFASGLDDDTPSGGEAREAFSGGFGDLFGDDDDDDLWD